MSGLSTDSAWEEQLREQWPEQRESQRVWMAELQGRCLGLKVGQCGLRRLPCSVWRCSDALVLCGGRRGAGGAGVIGAAVACLAEGVMRSVQEEAAEMVSRLSHRRWRLPGGIGTGRSR